MIAFLGTTFGKILLGIIMPGVLAAVKAGAAQAWERVPAWLQPLVSSLLGAVAGATATAAAGATDGPSLLAGAGVGAGAGALGKAGRDAGKTLGMWGGGNG